MPCLLTGVGSLQKRKPSRVTLQPLASLTRAKKSPEKVERLPDLFVSKAPSEKELMEVKRVASKKKTPKTLQLLDAALMTPKSSLGGRTPKSTKSTVAMWPGTPSTESCAERCKFTYKSDVYGTPRSASSTSPPSSPEPRIVEPKAIATPTATPATPITRARRAHRRFTMPAVSDSGSRSSKVRSTPQMGGCSPCPSSMRSWDATTPASRPCCSPLQCTAKDLNLAVATGTFGTWRRGHRIGSGSHGCVFKAQDTVTGQIFAVKMADIEIHTAEDKQFAERLEAELQICKDLRHPHIVRYLGHEYMDAKLCIKLEFVPGGSLLALLSEFGPLEGVMMQTASRGLVEGLNYLHTHNPPVVHRDIKGANVLVDTDFCVKLADFGCSKRSSDTQSFVTIGSVPWMAPEVINQKSGHGRKADIWSLGCTLIEMATAEKPWGADKFNNIMFALHHIGMSEETPPVPEALPPAGRDIVAQCVQRDPSDRMGAQELLEHEFIRGVPSTRPHSTSV